MSNAYIGEIRLFPYSYAPEGWAHCNGQTLTIQDHQALFSVIGITYGGDGRTTFGLPNLKGRVPMGFGQGSGLSNYVQGEMEGSASIELSLDNLPVHSHTLEVSTGKGEESAMTSTNIPGQLVSGTGKRETVEDAYASDTPTQAMHENSLSSAGQSSPHENRQPFLVVPFCICLNGLYPSRS